MAEMTHEQKNENSKRLSKLEWEKGHKARAVARKFIDSFNRPSPSASHGSKKRQNQMADGIQDRSLRKASAKDVKKYVSKLEKEKAKKEKKAKRKGWLKRTFESALNRKKK